MKMRRHMTVLLVCLVIAFLLLPLTCELYGDKRGQITITTNEKGIPTVDYGNPIGKQINPVTVSLYALDYFEEYKKGDECSKQLFLNCADFLVNNLIDKGNYSVWEYNFPWKIYNMTPPWRSAMAQGLGIQVLAYAYNLTGERRYLESARRALNAFYVDVQEGGVTIKENGGCWYEEYADEGGKMSRVLNGHNFALLGIYEYYKITGDIDAKYLFDKGVASLKRHAHEYDANCWTYYDALGNLADEKYHNIHIKQMLELYNITGDELFKDYYEKWNSYNSYFNRLIKPSKLEIRVFVVNLFLIIILFETVIFLIRYKRRKIV